MVFGQLPAMGINISCNYSDKTVLEFHQLPCDDKIKSRYIAVKFTRPQSAAALRNQGRRFLLKKQNTEGGLKSPIFNDTAVTRRYRCVHFYYLQSLYAPTVKKSVGPASGYPDYKREICKYQFEYVVSCVCIALCCAGAFILTDQSSPIRCRSPPPLFRSTKI